MYTISGFGAILISYWIILVAVLLYLSESMHSNVYWNFTWLSRPNVNNMKKNRKAHNGATGSRDTPSG